MKLNIFNKFKCKSMNKLNKSNQNNCKKVNKLRKKQKILRNSFKLFKKKIRNKLIMIKMFFKI